MAERYDPLPDLAEVLTSVITDPIRVNVHANRIVEHLQLDDDGSPETVAAALREALGASRAPAAPEFGDRFTVKPDTGIVQLNCFRCPGFPLGNDDWDVGYHPSLDVLVEQARAHDAEKHGVQAPEPAAFARCQDPAEHGMPHCWCAVPEHHKPLGPGLPTRVYLLACGDQVAYADAYAPGDAVCCAEHGDTTIVMTIPLGSATCEGGC